MRLQLGEPTHVLSGLFVVDWIITNRRDYYILENLYANFFTMGKIDDSKSNSAWSVALMWMPTPDRAALMASLEPL
jgi:hypothetical protein